MSSYTLAALISLLTGWLAQAALQLSLLLANSDSTRYGNGFEFALQLAGLALAFSVVAHLLFIQLPRTYIKRLYFSTHSSFLFALLLMAYGVVIVFLVAGVGAAFGSKDVSFFTSFVFSGSLMIGSGTLLNGFVFGLTFHSIWKPAEADPE